MSGVLFFDLHLSQILKLKVMKDTKMLLELIEQQAETIGNITEILERQKYWIKCNENDIETLQDRIDELEKLLKTK